jgi:hypothetical protein
MTLVVWLIGWPGIVLSLSLLFVGIATRRPHVMLAGAFMSLPFLLLYLIGSPRFQYWSPILVAFNFAAVTALYKGRRGLSVLLVIPYTCVVFWLGYAVYTQNAPLEDSEYREEEMHGPIAPNEAMAEGGHSGDRWSGPPSRDGNAPGREYLTHLGERLSALCAGTKIPAGRTAMGMAVCVPGRQAQLGGTLPPLPISSGTPCHAVPSPINVAAICPYG